MDVQVDLSDITIVSDRKSMYDLCEMEGEVGVRLNVKEITDAVSADEYSYELYQQIATTSFGLAQMEAQYYSGYDWSVNEVFVGSEGNEYTAEFGYDYVVRIFKNGVEVFSKQLEKPKKKPSVRANEDGKFLCSKCNHWVSHATSSGYCGNCVDIYVNDWYVAIDGNVYVDRPY